MGAKKKAAPKKAAANLTLTATAASRRAPRARKGSAKDSGGGRAVGTKTAESRDTTESGLANEAKPRVRDPRLPEPGTVLVKRDRSGAVRCECTVMAEGIRYDGKLYSSLSAAAMAAAKSMGIGGNQNGYVFWGLTKTSRRNENPIERLEKAWARYVDSAKMALASPDEGGKKEAVALIERYSEVEIAT